MPRQTQETLVSPKVDSGSYDASNSWHPFTQMQEFSALPQVAIERGKGCWLEDMEGQRYLDGTASLWTNVHGHGHPELDAAIRDQLGRVAHSTYLGLTHRPGNLLERKLVELASPELLRVFFSDNGSCAVEIALKLSFQYWQLMGHPQKTEVIAMEGAYHGDTFGAMSVGGGGVFHGRFEHWCFPVNRFPKPVCKEVAGDVLETDDAASLAILSGLLTKRGGRTAALIIEPWVQGAAGMQLQPRDFVLKVESLCREHGVHLILDEVFTGFGRVGPMLVCREMGVRPDFLCLAKGLTAGYLPLAATLATEEVFEAFLGEPSEHRQFFHGHTFTANPLASAVSLKNIELLERMLADEDFSERLVYFGESAQKYFSGHRHVAEVRQRGFICAVDLCPEGQPSESFASNARIGQKVCLRARALGLLLRPLGDSLLLVPPLVIDRHEIDLLFKRTVQAINETFQQSSMNH